MLAPIKSGFQYRSNGEVCISWAVFSVGDIATAWNTSDIDSFTSEELAQELTGWHSHPSRGSGRWFAYEPTSKRYGGKILVKHYCGLDV